MKYQDLCRTEIVFADAEQLKEICLTLPYQRIVLVMSEQAKSRYHLEELVDTLGNKYELLWLKESVTYPTQETLEKGLNQLKDFAPEVLIAIGGGSAIDFAKGLKAFYEPGRIYTVQAITELLQNKKVLQNEMDIIAVPTTAGTGAEVTKWATIWDYENKCKYSIDHDILKPEKAVIVPEFTTKADEKLTISTGLDAMAHAMEAYWSKKSTPLVRQLAGQSIGLTIEYLRKIVEAPENLALREKQCLASLLAGLAFSMTRTTACHSISYPLTMQYRIPHGTAVSMTLAQVAERNRGSFAGEEALFALFENVGGIRAYLEQICGDYISLRLRDYGISEKDIPGIVQGTFTLGRMDNNPVAFDAKDVEEILKETF